MKTIISISIILFCLLSCDQQKSYENGIALGDTIRTESGLAYIYLKKGEGRKIEYGTKVDAYNKLIVNDSVVWSTDNDPDSVFSFVESGSGLIKGALELYPKLRQGDEVIAIMPDSIAYGDRGAGIIPPGATLIFNPIKIKRVSEPKKFLGDTLFQIIKEKDTKTAIAAFQELNVPENSKTHYLELNYMRTLLKKLIDEKRYQAVIDMSSHFENVAEEEYEVRLFRWNKVLAAENLGEFKAAIQYLEPFLKTKNVNPFYTNKLNELKSKLK